MHRNDPVPGRIDRRKPLIGNHHELMRHTSGNQPVGMAFGNPAAIVRFQPVEIPVRIGSEDCVGVTDLAIHVPHLDAFERDGIETKNRRDFFQKQKLVLMDDFIRLGDVEQCIEYIVQDRFVAGIVTWKQDRTCCGIGIEASDVLLGRL